MAEPSLSLTYSELAKEVGHFLGYGSDDSVWSSEQSDDVDRIVQSGYRQFLNPPLLPGMQVIHQWSFLRPVTTLDTVADQADYDLPDNFGGMDGCLTYDDNNAYPDIKIVGENQIRSARSGTSSMSGRPYLAAVRYKQHSGTPGQRWEIMFYPTPDAAYTLSYRYRALRNKLTDSSPYPLGGADHAETILESCLAIAERRKDDAIGLHDGAFKERLAASIAMDGSIARADSLGYNGDPSTERETVRYGRQGGFTVNGLEV